MISSMRLRNSGRKVSLERLQQPLLDLVVALLHVHRLGVGDQPGADVAGHDDDGVLEVDGAALVVGQAAVVQDLQQHVEHVGVRLLDLVEEHDAVRPAAHRLGELAALLVAHVAGRRADQPRDGVLLHVLAHVEPHHGLLVVEEELGQRPRQLGLADAGRAEEHERADRPLRVLEPGAGAADGLARRQRPPRPGRSRARAAAPPSPAASRPPPPSCAAPGCRSRR